MSVRVGDRSEGKLQVLECSSNLVKYTMQICRNEKIFPKSQRWIMTQKLVNTTIDATACIREANAVYVSSDPLTCEQEFKYRRQKQMEAHSYLNSLLTLIDIAFQTFSIEARKIEYWTNLVVETDNKLKAWMKSDKEKYAREHK